jgi:hypothetical protein
MLLQEISVLQKISKGFKSPTSNNKDDNDMLDRLYNTSPVIMETVSTYRYDGPNIDNDEEV